MSWQFGKISLADTGYARCANGGILDPVPVDAVLKVYREYCRHKHFRSVMPMLPGRLCAPNTEIIGYHVQSRLVAWSMYRVWDNENVLSDHFAWDYREPKLRLGIRSIQNECALYRDRGFKNMYFESVQPYMLDLDGFELLGSMS